MPLLVTSCLFFIDCVFVFQSWSNFLCGCINKVVCQNLYMNQPAVIKLIKISGSFAFRCYSSSFEDRHDSKGLLTHAVVYVIADMTCAMDVRDCHL